MERLAALREKYDLHMTVERFVREDIGTDEQFIRRWFEKNNNLQFNNLNIAEGSESFFLVSHNVRTKKMPWTNRPGFRGDFVIFTRMSDILLAKS